MGEKDPARIAKILGWCERTAKTHCDGEYFAWVDVDGNFKAWVDEWNPYTTDADALFALTEWFRQDPINRRGGTTFKAHWRCELQWRVQPEEKDRAEWPWYDNSFKAKFGHGSFCEAITNALERWGDGF